MASTPRTFNRQTNEWEDGTTLFMSCSIWRDAAENVAESLHRGMRVIATGRLKSRSYDTKDNPPQKRTVIELDVDEVGPSLRYASAKVTKAERNGSGGGFGGQQQGGGQRAADPWATGAPRPRRAARTTNRRSEVTDNRPVRLGVVPAEPVAPIPNDEFPQYAKGQWDAARAAYADAFRHVWAMHGLLHKPGQVQVVGTVTGALHEAKRLRDDADRMIVALDAIVAQSRRK